VKGERTGKKANKRRRGGGWGGRGRTHTQKRIESLLKVGNYRFSYKSVQFATDDTYTLQTH